MKKEEIFSNILFVLIIIAILFVAYFFGVWQMNSQNKYEKDLSDAKYQVFLELKNLTTQEKLDSIDFNCEAYVSYQKERCIRTLRHDFFEGK